ncbi:hypothetical protein ADL29_29005 [Streptomyces chattanoogensis]|uniref:DUF4352 domain-containing protein n=1 Tax=Streptomyces chattanoogensis TaxID=66876 RepID=A0A0N0GWX4_9ACTN|nr:hypothetical protein ADL29_29005 [Streptomyces chattanoogensis]
MVLTSLVLLGIAALAWVVESVKDPRRLENGSSLGPGGTAEYADGLSVTVSAPSREPDGSYRFTITYDNDADEPISPIGGSEDGVSQYEISHDPLIVRAGKRYGADAAAPGDLNWANDEQVARKLLPSLEEGESVTVPIHITDAKRGTPVTVEVEPQSAGYREGANWEFTLD